jgi:hypothetical protein
VNGEANVLRIPLAANDTLARARAVLAQSQVLRSRGLSVSSQGEKIILRGKVSLFYHKQLAQELIRAEISDVSLVNEIQVHFEG